MPNTAAAVGLCVIVISYVLLTVALRTRRASLQMLCGVGAVALWLLSAIAFLGLLALEGPGYSTSDLWCEVPGRSSEFSPSHWQWMPVGKVCEFPTGDVGPTNWRAPAAFALLAFAPIGIGVLAFDDWREENRVGAGDRVRRRASTSRAGA